LELEWIVRLIAERAERLDRFLALHIPSESRNRLATHIATGGVLVEGVTVQPAYRLRPGDRVDVSPLHPTIAHSLEPVDIALTPKYEDEHILVVDKPKGLAVHPSPTSSEPTLVHGLLARSHELSRENGAYRPGIVHRLDKDTSGLLLVAKSDAIHRALQRAIQARTVKRGYLAVVRGRPAENRFTIDSYIGRHPRNRLKMAVVDAAYPGARPAVTHVETHQPYDDRHTILRCTLETGRTHQIRVHLASVGLPIAGDSLYGVAHPHFASQALHAFQLSFVHPVSGVHISLESLPSWDTQAGRDPSE
jgi:23S rRNA pseudouridine1911/1915/1917 synthase